MKYSPEQITEDMLREVGPVEKAMARAFTLKAPPMPEFKDAPRQPKSYRALEDDELDCLQAAGVQMHHLPNDIDKIK